ncbi:hypothetical protein GCM10022289_23190 [Pedobacter jeongneungensis]|uniref:Uncharacterized protein n=1 Tax=Pedobacter jeongneungensis TaxID=947309 RepID=A0ABP8BE27_9SPHI
MNKKTINYKPIRLRTIRPSTKKSDNYQSKTLIFPKFTPLYLLYEENIPLYPCRNGKFAA